MLPAADAGFECRLGRAGLPVDFAVCYDEQSLGQLLPLLSRLQATASGPAWQRAAELFTVFLTPDTVFQRASYKLWLEFDDRPDGTMPPAPRLFLPLRRLYQEHAGMAEAEINRQAVLPLLREVRQRLAPSAGAPLDEACARVIAGLPAGAYVYSVGTVLQEAPRSLRLAIGGVLPAALTAWLCAVPGYGQFPQAAIARLLADLGTLTEPVSVAVEIGEQRVAPRFGVMVMNHLLAHEPLAARWQRVLTLLQERGLVRPEEAAALLAWQGTAGGVTLTKSHLKIECGSDGDWQAKAYAGFLIPSR